MEENVKRSIRLVESKKKSSVPWSFDAAHSQPYYSFQDADDGGHWSTGIATRSPQAQSAIGIRSLAVLSWNIDFMMPFDDSRMSAALQYMESLVARQPADMAIVIFLAECVASDLKLMQARSWIQRAFNMTDLNGSNWQSGHYGTTMLVDRRLPIEASFRVHFSETRMERDGFFTDVLLNNNTIRLCTTHLESLALEPPLRPAQMRMCARYMHDAKVDGAVVAGDFNAIQDFDKHLHSDNDLKDAYLELGGSEDDAEGGHTWGQQAAIAQRNRFGTSRMDKIFYCGRLRCTSFERFGAGVEVSDEEERQHIIGLGFDRPYVTDHLGVKAVFEVATAHSEHDTS